MCSKSLVFIAFATLTFVATSVGEEFNSFATVGVYPIHVRRLQFTYNISGCLCKKFAVAGNFSAEFLHLCYSADPCGGAQIQIPAQYLKSVDCTASDVGCEILPAQYGSCGDWIADSTGNNASVACPILDCCKLATTYPSTSKCPKYCYDLGPDSAGVYNRQCGDLPLNTYSPGAFWTAPAPPPFVNYNVSGGTFGSGSPPSHANPGGLTDKQVIGIIVGCIGGAALLGLIVMAATCANCLTMCRGRKGEWQQEPPYQDTSRLYQYGPVQKSMQTGPPGNRHYGHPGPHPKHHQASQTPYGAPVGTNPRSHTGGRMGSAGGRGATPPPEEYDDEDYEGGGMGGGGVRPWGSNRTEGGGQHYARREEYNSSLSAPGPMGHHPQSAEYPYGKLAPHSPSRMAGYAGSTSHPPEHARAYISEPFANMAGRGGNVGREPQGSVQYGTREMAGWEGERGGYSQRRGGTPAGNGCLPSGPCGTGGGCRGEIRTNEDDSVTGGWYGNSRFSGRHEYGSPADVPAHGGGMGGGMGRSGIGGSIGGGGGGQRPRGGAGGSVTYYANSLYEVPEHCSGPLAEHYGPPEGIAGQPLPPLPPPPPQTGGFVRPQMVSNKKVQADLDDNGVDGVSTTCMYDGSSIADNSSLDPRDWHRPLQQGSYLQQQQQQQQEHVQRQQTRRQQEQFDYGEGNRHERYHQQQQQQQQGQQGQLYRMQRRGDGEMMQPQPAPPPPPLPPPPCPLPPSASEATQQRQVQHQQASRRAVAVVLPEERSPREERRRGANDPRVLEWEDEQRNRGAQRSAQRMEVNTASGGDTVMTRGSIVPAAKLVQRQGRSVEEEASSGSVGDEETAARNASHRTDILPGVRASRQVSSRTGRRRVDKEDSATEEEEEEEETAARNASHRKDVRASRQGSSRAARRRAEEEDSATAEEKEGEEDDTASGETEIEVEEHAPRSGPAARARDGSRDARSGSKAQPHKRGDATSTVRTDKAASGPVAMRLASRSQIQSKSQSQRPAHGRSRGANTHRSSSSSGGGSSSRDDSASSGSSSDGGRSKWSRNKRRNGRRGRPAVAEKAVIEDDGGETPAVEIKDEGYVQELLRQVNSMLSDMAALKSNAANALQASSGGAAGSETTQQQRQEQLERHGATGLLESAGLASSSVRIASGLGALSSIGMGIGGGLDSEIGRAGTLDDSASVIGSGGADMYGQRLSEAAVAAAAAAAAAVQPLQPLPPIPPARSSLSGMSGISEIGRHVEEATRAALGRLASHATVPMNAAGLGSSSISLGGGFGPVSTAGLNSGGRSRSVSPLSRTSRGAGSVPPSVSSAYRLGSYTASASPAYGPTAAAVAAAVGGGTGVTLSSSDDELDRQYREYYYLERDREHPQDPSPPRQSREASLLSQPSTRLGSYQQYPPPPASTAGAGSSALLHQPGGSPYHSSPGGLLASVHTQLSGGQQFVSFTNPLADVLERQAMSSSAAAANGGAGVVAPSAPASPLRGTVGGGGSRSMALASQQRGGAGGESSSGDTRSQPLLSDVLFSSLTADLAWEVASALGRVGVGVGEPLSDDCIDLDPYGSAAYPQQQPPPQQPQQPQQPQHYSEQHSQKQQHDMSYDERYSYMTHQHQQQVQQQQQHQQKQPQQQQLPYGRLPLPSMGYRSGGGGANTSTMPGNGTNDSARHSSTSITIGGGMAEGASFGQHGYSGGSHVEVQGASGGVRQDEGGEGGGRNGGGGVFTRPRESSALTLSDRLRSLATMASDAAVRLQTFAPRLATTAGDVRKQVDLSPHAASPRASAHPASASATAHSPGDALPSSGPAGVTQRSMHQSPAAATGSAPRKTQPQPHTEMDLQQQQPYSFPQHFNQDREEASRQRLQSQQDRQGRQQQQQQDSAPSYERPMSPSLSSLTEEGVTSPEPTASPWLWDSHQQPSRRGQQQQHQPSDPRVASSVAIQLQPSIASPMPRRAGAASDTVELPTPSAPSFSGSQGQSTPPRVAFLSTPGPIATKPASHSGSGIPALKSQSVSQPPTATYYPGRPMGRSQIPSPMAGDAASGSLQRGGGVRPSERDAGDFASSAGRGASGSQAGRREEAASDVTPTPGQIRARIMQQESRAQADLTRRSRPYSESAWEAPGGGGGEGAGDGGRDAGGERGGERSRAMTEAESFLSMAADLMQRTRVTSV